MISSGFLVASFNQREGRYCFGSGNAVLSCRYQIGQLLITVYSQRISNLTLQHPTRRSRETYPTGNINPCKSNSPFWYNSRQHCSSSSRPTNSFFYRTFQSRKWLQGCHIIWPFCFSEVLKKSILVRNIVCQSPENVCQCCWSCISSRSQHFFCLWECWWCWKLGCNHRGYEVWVCLMSWLWRCETSELACWPLLLC